MMKLAMGLWFALSACAMNADAEATGFAQLRQQFLQAERKVNSGQEADYAPLAQGLKNYPLYPYLQYQWLKNHLEDREAVLQFLEAYPHTRYAPVLREKWLEQLARRQQWALLLQHYQPVKNTVLQCQYHQAQYDAGQRQAALDAARVLWVSGKAQSEACEPLFARLRASSFFAPDLVWQRFHNSLQADNLARAEPLLKLMTANDRRIAEDWLRIHQQPRSVETLAVYAANPHAAAIFAHGIARLADDQPSLAALLWDKYKSRLALPSQNLQQTEQRLGLALALNREPSAYRRLADLAIEDESIREWRVRAALLEQNWQHVLNAIAGLSPTQQQQERWLYWRARALQQTGQQPLAQAVWQQLSKERGIYGFLAADYLQQPIALRHRPVPVSDNAVRELQARQDFQMVAEFKALNRESEAKAQWWFAVEKLNEQEVMAAAKLAQHWEWQSVAIFTLAKVKYWDDMDLRFPLAYLDSIQQQAAKYQLAPSLVLGLIRQETAFDPEAQSSAGAKGLMQIMPKTGEQMAQMLKQPWQGDSSLFNPDRNIAYGTAYYKKLLGEFSGHYALAAAAYNAGGNRVKRWLPSDNAMPGDVWMELIPYKETRAYVAAVLGYALIYQQRLQHGGLRASDLLRPVSPG